MIITRREQDMKGKILYLLDFIYAIVLSVFLLVTMIIYIHTKASEILIIVAAVLFAISIVKGYWIYRKWRRP
jgi:FtsH-binding integral membrane protein